MWDLIVSVPDHCLSFYSVTEEMYFFFFHPVCKLNDKHKKHLTMTKLLMLRICLKCLN